MKQFSITNLEQFTKVKAHTFRTWEQRYLLPRSKRGQNKLRYYTIDDLDYYLDFCLLNRYGYKVSKLAELGHEEIRQKVFQLEEKPAVKENIIHKLIVYMFSLEIDAFESTLNHAISKFGVEEAMEDVILSFIERIDLFSYKGNSGTEYHFAVTILRKKLILAIEQAKAPKQILKTALLFLPEGEHFDLLLLYIHYQLLTKGIKSFYLGTNIPLQHLNTAVEKKQPDYLITYFDSEEKKFYGKLLNFVSAKSNQLLFVAKPFVNLKDQVSQTERLRFMRYKSVVEEMIST